MMSPTSRAPSPPAPSFQWQICAPAKWPPLATGQPGMWELLRQLPLRAVTLSRAVEMGHARRQEGPAQAQNQERMLQGGVQRRGAHRCHKERPPNSGCWSPSQNRKCSANASGRRASTQGLQPSKRARQTAKERACAESGATTQAVQAQGAVRETRALHSSGHTLAAIPGAHLSLSWM